MKILLQDDVINSTSAAEQDSYGRSPLELARIADDMSFDNVLGHLQSQEPRSEYQSVTEQLKTKSRKKRRRTKIGSDENHSKKGMLLVNVPFFRGVLSRTQFWQRVLTLFMLFSCCNVSILIKANITMINNAITI